MDVGIPDKPSQAIRVQVWLGVPLVCLFGALEAYQSSTDTWIEVFTFIVLFFITTLAGIYWNALLPRWLRFPSTELAYLSDKNSELGWAIRAAASYSAWGKWYAAQILVNSGKPITDISILGVAAGIVTGHLMNGDIEVRGRLPGKLEYEVIHRTAWRSSAVVFIHDPVKLWRLVIAPRGIFQLNGNGDIVHASNPASVERTGIIRKYDSLIVDSAQFEKVWPKNEWKTDMARYAFLREARRRNLDEVEMIRLTRDWNFLFLLSWIR